jgi:hypothetical protein
MSELSKMSEAAFEATTRRIDEMPSRGRGGFVIGVQAARRVPLTDADAFQGAEAAGVPLQEAEA